jgi:hypothetical protein
MTQRGDSLKQIHQDTGVDLVVIKQFLPHVIEETVVRLTSHIDAGLSERAVLALDSPSPTKLHRTFFYSCQSGTNQLNRINLLTGLKSCHKVPDYQFRWHCVWSELPGGSLLITGGEFAGERRRED